jgi:hypothetical protein
MATQPIPSIVVTIPPISPAAPEPMPKVCEKAVITVPPTDPSFTPASKYCEELAAKIKEIETDAEIKKHIVDSVAKTINPLGYLINSLIPKNETHTMVLNTLKSDIVQKSMANATSICNQTSNIDQSNIFTGPSDKCIATMGTICASISDDKLKDQCLQNMMSGFEVKDLSMINESRSNNTCNMASTISQVLSSTNDLNTQATMQALQKLSGFASGSNSTESMQCNRIESNISSTQFANAVSCCMNQINTRQQNLAGPCGKFINNKFINKSNTMSNCLQRVGISISSTGESKTSASGDVKLENESEGIDMTTVLIVSAIVAGIAGVIVLIVLINMYL